MRHRHYRRPAPGPGDRFCSALLWGAAVGLLTYHVVGDFAAPAGWLAFCAVVVLVYAAGEGE